MKIERNGQIIELTDEELRSAFYEQQHIFLLMDAQEYLEQELRRRFVLEGESDSMLDTVIRAYYGYGFNALICEDSGHYALEELVRLFQKWQSTEDGGWYTWAFIINDYIDEEMHKVDEAIQDVVQRIDRSYKAFFDHVKKKRSGRKSPPHFCKIEKYKSLQSLYQSLNGWPVTLAQLS